MTRNTARAIAGAVALGGALLCLPAGVSISPAQAAATITNRAVGVPLQEAQQLAGQRNWTAAIAKAREARGADGITPAETNLIDQLIGSYMLQARDYRGALAHYEGLAARGVNRQVSLQAALMSALQLNNLAKAQELANQMPGGAGNAEIYIAQGMSRAGNHREAIRRATPLAQRNPPSQDALEVLEASYNALNDAAGRRNALEQLVLHYPTAARWSNLIRLTRNQRGLTDAQQLDLFRIRALVGDLKTAEDYSEMAQMALIVGYPADAKAILDAGVEEDLLTGERSERLIALTNERLAADGPVAAALVSQAAADASGNTDIRLGLSMLSYGRAADAEAAIQRGIAKGGVTDADGARVALGRALLAQDKRQEAVRAFNAVPRTSPQAPIARLWSLYAQRG